ncbi:LapA family protein [Aurantiacibacter gangjinensis]|uniref:LapA family protein n=1 Tax=Aurantiacibacter gangjinensis TaxID=502682 RepID=UPI00069AD2A3|nr:LapA family protein [Aurantiacibacter gangjinensis]APE28450.1 hypothetical protein BMF35_a1621 [Aurantiacibacter gangjinensis]
MQIVRTIIWVLLLVALLLFSILNWEEITVTIWPGAEPSPDLVVDTKIPVLVIISFLIGFLPMWLYHRGSKWRLNRKIASLENAARTAAATPVAASTEAEPEDTVQAEPDLRSDPATPLRPREPVSEPAEAETVHADDMQENSIGIEDDGQAANTSPVDPDDTVAPAKDRGNLT